MTYHQFMNWVEDDHGDVTVRVVIADSYDDLFVDISESTEFNALIINETSEKLSNNAIINHELKFSINEALIDKDDEEVVALIKSAENIDNSIFIGILLDGVVLFQGIIEQKIEAEDLNWSGEHYSSDISPLRHLKFTAKTYNSAVIETFTMNDLINGNTEKSCPGIDTTWETANVKDRQGYFHISDDLDRRVCVDSLVNLNDLLRKLADNLESAIFENGYGSLSIRFNRAQITGNWHPTRWNLDIRNTLWGLQSRYLLWEWNELFQYRSPVFKRYREDYVNIYLDPDGKPETIVEDEYGLPDDESTKVWYKSSPWISYRKVKELDNELSQKVAEQNIISKIDNFLEYIQRIAQELGMFAKIFIDTENTLQITFINRSESLGVDISIKSADKATIKPTKDTINEYALKTNSFYWAEEGFDLYTSFQRENNLQLFKLDLVKNLNDGINDLTLFSISPTVRYIPRGRENGQSLQNCFLPHNHVFYNGSTKKSGLTQDGINYSDAIGQHSAIYLCVENYETHEDSEFSPDFYWTPAAAVSFKVNTKDYYFTKFNDLYKFFYKYDIEFMMYEYNLVMPWFYAGKIGESIDWQALAIFNRVELDDAIWSIVEVKRDYSNKNTTIVLQSQTRFSYNNSYVGEFEEVNGIPGEADSTLPDYLSPGLSYSEDITPYDLVILNESGEYERALPIASHYHKIAGIAIFNNENVFESIKKDGLIYSDLFADEVINTRVHLRLTESGNNWTTSPLTEKTIESEVVAEDMILCIGKYVAYKTIEINNSFRPRFVIE